MAKIVRFNGNLVAPASAALGTERTLFGSVAQADDLTSQFTADLLRGWGIVGPSDQPTLQDFNAMGYTLGHLHAYLHQVGVPEWNALQEYHIGSIANVAGVLYSSLTNNNVGNDPTSSPLSWTTTTMVPDASTTVKGIVELATSAETLALTDSGRAVTPAGLAPLFGMLKVAHIVAQNTSVAGAAGVNTRPLNTVQHNSITGASLATNQITLPAGTYEISGYGMCTANAIKTYLYNVTDAANLLLGSSVANNNANDADQGRIDGVFTLAATKVLEVRHSLTAPVTSTALGRLTNLVGNEVYSVFTIRRIG